MGKGKQFLTVLIVCVVIVGVCALIGICSSSGSRSSSNSGTTTSSRSSFTNKYGTPTTICAHPGCTNYIASSGDTNCCTKHSNRCGNCGKYIDEDAMFCMDCLRNALNGN